MIPSEIREAYIKQGYRFVGEQTVVKPCHWLRESLRTRGRKFCYKQKWYGIPSHRCLQMSPVIQCSNRCVFCWRAQPNDIGIKWEELKVGAEDAPSEIVRRSVMEWRQVLSGFKGNPNIDQKMLEEAFRPIHAAISLVGEPTLYPKIGELIEEIFNHGFKTTFLVTNGTFPEVLANLGREPSQLYVSVAAPNEDMYENTCRPQIPDSWRRLNETLDMLHSFRCPTVMRITLVRGINMEDYEGYAKLIAKAEPTYVEPKAAMSLGYSRLRLPVEAMPRYSEVEEFGIKVSELTGYRLLDGVVDSRIVLLSRLKRPIRLI